MSVLSLNSNSNFITFSTTSILLSPSNKLDNIICKLEGRKNQIIESIAKSKKKTNVKGSYSDNIDDMKDGGICSELEERKKKYETKIMNQTKEKDELDRTVKQIEQRIFKSVVDLENNEMRLKEISENIGIKFRQGFGLNYEKSETSKKWISHKILQLQSQIQIESLKMRKILVKFYIVEQGMKEDEKCGPPVCSLLDYIIKMRLVNKLYSFLLHNKQYREYFLRKKQMKNESSYSIESQQQQQEESDQESSIQVTPIKSNVEYRQNPLMSSSLYKSDHDTWLKILKLMKSLQKLQPIPATFEQKIELESQDERINIKQFHDDTKVIIESVKKIKKECKSIKQKLADLRKEKEEIDQQISIKNQLLESYLQKVNKLQKEIKEERLRQEAKHKNANPENLLGEVNKKQLKQVEQAIKYFNAKRLDKTKTSTDRNMTISKKLKTIGDLSTVVSPQKSIMSRDRLLSPDLTINKRQNSKKYSLKNLLSPPKPPTSNLQKRVAWK